MTIFEFFRERYIAATTSTRPVIKISETVERGSFRWVSLWFDHACGGAWDYQLKKAGITPEQISEARAAGLLSYKYYCSWMARATGNKNFYWLNRRGLKELYKQYKEW